MRRVAFLVALVCICGCGSRGAKSPETTSDQGSTAASSAAEESATSSPRQSSPLATPASALAGLPPEIQEQLRKAEEWTNEAQLGKAIELLGNIIGQHPEIPAAFVMRGRAHSELHQDADAFADFSSAIKLEPKNANNYTVRGFFLLTRGNTRLAIKDFDEAISLSPRDAQPYNRRGMARMATSDWKASIEDFNKAIDLDPKFVNAFVNRSFAYSKIDRRKEALADLDEAIRLDPKSAGSFNNRGALYVERQEYEKAVADFTSAIRLDHANLSYYHNRRSTYLKLERYAEAQADSTRMEKLTRLTALNEAVLRDPRFPKPYIDRGDYFLSEGRTKEATLNFDYAIKLDSNQWRAYLERARVWIRCGEYHKAVDDCTAALAIDSNDEICSVRGDAYRKLGEYDKAVADYDVSQRIDEDVAETWLQHSKALRDAGHAKEADEALARANELKQINVPVVKHTAQGTKPKVVQAKMSDTAR